MLSLAAYSYAVFLTGGSVGRPFNDPFPTRSDLDTTAGRFVTASDRAAARTAASDLALIAVDDYVAVSPLAQEVVAALRAAVEEGVPWIADAFAVIVHTMEHAQVWQALRKTVRTYRGEYDVQIGWELGVFRVLEDFDGTVRDWLVDTDPEIRSMACLLLSWISTSWRDDVELFRMLIDADSVDLARACAGEAAMRVLSGHEAEREELALRLLTDQSAIVRYRVARNVTSSVGHQVSANSEVVVAAARSVVESIAPGELTWCCLAEEL